VSTYLTVALLAFFIVLSLTLFFQLRKTRSKDQKLELETELYNLTITSSPGGYYYWDADQNSERFSKNLISMFNIHQGVENFHQFIERFGEQGNTLLNAIETLKQKTSGSFIIDVQTKQDKKDHYFKCSCNRINDSDGNIKGIIIWFLDISEKIRQFNSIVEENLHLKQENTTLSKILDSLPIPIWQRNENFELVYSNKPYKVNATEGNSSEFYKEEKLDIKKTLKENKASSSKKHIIINGDRKLFEIFKKPLIKENSVISFAQDITSEEKIKKELGNHINAHSELLENSSSAIAIYGSDKNLMFYNQSFVKLWDLNESWLNKEPSYGDVLEKLREKRSLPEQVDFKAFKKAQNDLFKDLIEPDNDFFHLPDGRTLRIIAIPHAMGGLMFVYEDITDRLAMERMYNTLIAVQKETLDNLSEGILVFGEDGIVKLHNPKFSSLWPETKGLIEQKPHMSELFEKTKNYIQYDEKWDSYKASLISDISAHKASVRRTERKDGKIIEQITVPLPDGGNLVSFVDITDSTLVERSLRERNEALEEADRAKKQFLASVSYELRTPLTSIVGFSEMLHQGYIGELNQKQKDYTDSIYKSSTTLMSLINDILDLASFEAGNIELDVAKMDIKKCI